jgi:hypothetical protein
MDEVKLTLRYLSLGDGIGAFLRAVRARDLGIGDFQVGRATGESSLGLGYPVLEDRNKVSGVVLAPSTSGGSESTSTSAVLPERATSW